MHLFSASEGHTGGPPRTSAEPPSGLSPERSYVLFSDVRDYAMFLCCILSLLCRVVQHRRREGELHRQFIRIVAAVEEQKRADKRAVRQRDTNALRGQGEEGAARLATPWDEKGREELQMEMEMEMDRQASQERPVRSSASLVLPLGANLGNEEELFQSFVLPAASSELRREYNAGIRSSGGGGGGGLVFLRDWDEAAVRGGRDPADEGGDALLHGEAYMHRKDALTLLWEGSFEKRVETCVNWLSVISNCLTYFLRPSQVLYTFLFNNADFFLYVMSSLNKLDRTARLRLVLLKARLWRSRLLLRRSAAGGGAALPPSSTARRRQHQHAEPLLSSTWLEKHEEQPQDLMRPRWWGPRVVRRQIALLRTVATHAGLAALAVVDFLVLAAMEAVGFVADVVQALLPATGTAAAVALDSNFETTRGSTAAEVSRRHRGRRGKPRRETTETEEETAAAQMGEEEAAMTNGEPDIPPLLTHSPSSDTDTDTDSISIASDSPRYGGTHVRGEEIAPVDPAMAYVSLAERWLEGPWALVGLNAVFTMALMVCHVTHLLFPLGALAGYLACCGTLLLLGQELARVWQRHQQQQQQSLLLRIHPLRNILCCTASGPKKLAKANGKRLLPLLRRWWAQALRTTATALRRRRGNARASTNANVPDGVFATLATARESDGECSSDKSPLASPPTSRSSSSPLYSALYVLEHLFACGCAIFYLLMLFEEGEALWSTHVELMRWYVATVAMGVKELLLCLPPVTTTTTTTTTTAATTVAATGRKGRRDEAEVMDVAGLA